MGVAAVELWRVDLSYARDSEAHPWDCLDPEERQRASRFHFQDDRDRFVAARGALRRILARYLDQRPESVRFAYAAAGKPYLPDCPDLQFNLSHAGDRLLVGISRGRRLGVDIERVPPDSVVDTTSGLVLSDPESDMLRRLSGGERRERFAFLWTRKEAYIKADGRGMGLKLNLIDVGSSPDRVLLRQENSSNWAPCPQWTLRSFAVDSGFAAAIAVEGLDWRLDCFSWPGDLRLAG